MIDHNKLIEFEISPQWLAGFFDGEGCIGLYLRKNRGYYDLSIKISQKDSLVLALISLKFPDSKIKSGHRVTELEFGSRKVQYTFLNYIKDYSIIKKSQILLALDFLNNVGDPVEISLQIKNEKFARKERTDFVH